MRKRFDSPSRVGQNLKTSRPRLRTERHSSPVHEALDMKTTKQYGVCYVLDGAVFLELGQEALGEASAGLARTHQVRHHRRRLPPVQPGSTTCSRTTGNATRTPNTVNGEPYVHRKQAGIL